MTSHLRFLTENVIPSTSTTIVAVAGTAVAAFPLSNLMTYTRGEYARVSFDGSDNIEISIDLGPPKSINCVFIGPSNLNTATDFSVELYNSGTLVTSTAMAAYQDVIPFGVLLWGVDPLGDAVVNTTTKPVWFTSVHVVDEIRLLFTDPNLTYANITYVLAGVYFEPTRNLSRGESFVQEDTTSHERTADGSLRTKTGIKYKRYSLSIDQLEETDRVQLQRRISKRNPFVISLFQATSSQEGDYTAVVRQTNSTSFVQPQPGFYSLPIEVEEV